ncbi:MAG: hypothetical protein ABI550_03370 [Ignavibacteriaceae bacterium]
MFYKVKAKYKEEKLSLFYKKLTDGSVSNQKPDGNEIVSSMERAKITEPGIIEWFEICFCPTPLQHERNTVYDHFLSDIKTKEVDEYGEVGGESFWSYLNANSNQK